MHIATALEMCFLSLKFGCEFADAPDFLKYWLKQKSQRRCDFADASISSQAQSSTSPPLSLHFLSLSSSRANATTLANESTM